MLFPTGKVQPHAIPCRYQYQPARQRFCSGRAGKGENQVRKEWGVKYILTGWVFQLILTDKEKLDNHVCNSEEAEIQSSVLRDGASFPATLHPVGLAASQTWLPTRRTFSYLELLSLRSIIIEIFHTACRNRWSSKPRGDKSQPRVCNNKGSFGCCAVLQAN